MKLKTPSNLKRFYYILKFSKQLLKTKQFIDLQSQTTKNMHLAHVVNLNKSDVLIAALKELSGI